MDESKICKEKCEAWCCKNRAVVFTKDGRIVTERHMCNFLNKDNTCSDYESRPDACKDYTCPLLAYFKREGRKATQ